MNQKTMEQLINVNDKKLEILKGASHLFEEQGKIEQVGLLAAKWLKDRL
jgi:hypothetical protein